MEFSKESGDGRRMDEYPFITIFDSEKVVGNIGTFVKGIPNMSAYELGYATGFGTEKLAEIALISKGVGLVRNISSGAFNPNNYQILANPFILRYKGLKHGLGETTFKIGIGVK